MKNRSFSENMSVRTFFLRASSYMEWNLSFPKTFSHDDRASPFFRILPQNLPHFLWAFHPLLSLRICCPKNIILYLLWSYCTQVHFPSRDYVIFTVDIGPSPLTKIFSYIWKMGKASYPSMVWEQKIQFKLKTRK